MNEAATDVIVARSRQAEERLSTMLVWSIVAHIALTAGLLVVRRNAEPPPPRQIMTISLGGAVGPRTGGMTQIGGRAVQAPAPEQQVRRAETPPAPEAPRMTVPNPRAKPQPRRERPTQAPPEATARTPNTGPVPSEGSARVETQNRGQGFGLSSAGGGTGGVKLDVDFCCPDYIVDMTQRIKANWRQDRSLVGSPTFRFTIMRDGTIQDVQLEKSSGFDVLDRNAERALTITRRLPPLPAQYTNPSLVVHLQFD